MRASPIKTRVCVVDSYGLIRRGLADLIGGQPDMEICGEAENANAALNTIMKVIPDVVTTEIALPGNSGLELIKSIRGLGQNIGILVVSMSDEFIYADRALRAGAHGFVRKQTEPSDIPNAIRKILAGSFAFTSTATDRMCEDLMRRKGTPNAAVGDLSDRELEIGCLIGAGATTREIGARLGVSVKTIETHRANIKRKLNLPNASRLMQFWVAWVANGENEPAESETADRAITVTPFPAAMERRVRNFPMPRTVSFANASV